MAGENIVVSVGQAGNQIGASFWQALCTEHEIDPRSGRPVKDEPCGNWQTFFYRPGDDPKGKYIPRSIIIDLEPSVADNVKETFDALFNPGNLVTGTDGAGNNFAVGHGKMGSQFVDKVLDIMEKEVQNTERLGGIMILHSLGGGTGSGFGSLIVKKLKENYPSIPLMSCAVLPSPKLSETVTEPYNAVFALNTLITHADACLVLDNEALYEIARTKLGIVSPTISDLNYLITEALINITASMRFSSDLSVNIAMRELITNLVPHPNLHFLLTSIAPLRPQAESDFETVSVKELIESLFQNSSMYAACSPDEGKYLTASVFYRGDPRDKPDVDASLANVKNKIPLSSWIPTAFKVGTISQIGANKTRSMVLLANNTEMATVFDKICEKFDKLWTRKAFSFWYTNEGMEENEIQAMRTRVGDLIREYRSAAISGTEYAKPYTEEPAAVAESKDIL